MPNKNVKKANGNMRDDKSYKPSNRKKPQFSKKRKEEQSSANSSKPKAESRFNDRDTSEPSKVNSPDWYKFGDLMLGEASNLQFMNVIGEIEKDTQCADSHIFKITPSLMAFSFTPTLGMTPVPADAPINIQSVAFKQFVQANITQKVDFEPADVAVQLGAMDSVFMMYYWCQRLYGIYRTRSIYNITMPDVYFKACGLNPANMEQGNEYITGMTWPEFLFELNTIAIKLATLVIPSQIKLFARHLQLVSNIYTDAPIAKAQQYIFTPNGLWRYVVSEESGHEGGALRFEKMKDFTQGQYQGLAGVIKFLNELVNSVFNDKTLRDMNQYFLKVYGAENMIMVHQLDPNYQVLPVYVPEILPQIHNMDVVGDWNYFGPSRLTNYYLQDSTGFIQWTPQVANYNTGAWRGSYSDKVLDMPTLTPSADDIAVASRLMVCGNTESVGNQVVTTITAYGSEIINHVMVYAGNNGYADIRYSLGIPWNANTLDPDNPYYPQMTNQGASALCRWMAFGYGPMLRFTNESPEGPYRADTTWYDILSDVDNLAYFNANVIRNLHRACLMGEIFVPSYFPMAGVR